MTLGAWFVGPLTRKGCAALIALALLACAALSPAAASGAGAASKLVSTIFRVLPGQQQTAESAVRRAGGHIGYEYKTLHAFQAKVPADRLIQLQDAPGIIGISGDARLQSQDDLYVYNKDSSGSAPDVAKLVKADQVWKMGYRGQGVGVALIDTGVVPVSGFSNTKVVNGPDLSFDSQSGGLLHLDLYGHGTHMGGIIAGNGGGFSGIAPSATLLNVKVGNAVGAADVSQVLAAIDWVVQHRNDPQIGAPIKVINLSWGTTSSQDYQVDPLAYAAEVAWLHGITVVASAGNGGTSDGRLNDPASDPYVIAVGAEDPHGSNGLGDDTIPDFSSRGDGVRNPDVVAPGKSIVSLRDPGSNIDDLHPEGRVSDTLFRGSGTSEAAAVVSGAAALLLSLRPNLTPDQVKALLTSTADVLPAADNRAQGAGLIDLKTAMFTPTPADAVQSWPRSTGTGSLEASRGRVHVTAPDGSVLSGEQDIFGNQFDTNSWSTNSWSGTSWTGGSWNGTQWLTNSWSSTWTLTGLTNSWSTNSWSTNSWSTNSWSTNSWSTNSWSTSSWSTNSWSTNSWSTNSWSTNSWSTNSWSTNSWSTSSWS